MHLTFREVTPATIPDFEAFFSAPGAPHFCWCIVWRRTTEESHHHQPADRKAQMLKRICAGTPVGLVAYDGDTAAGWVSIAPRDTHRNLGGPPAQADENIWSIACFFVPRKRRGQGTVRALIKGAIAHAKEKGATIVEAYPVDRAAPSYRYMGFTDVFAEAGFTDEGMAGTRRHVMRLRLRGKPEPTRRLRT
ncbi:MAG TPA: GNAT family N-acetyltransferase [Bauldia sp.]|nr:GNAT family N-acetyltransferase [Bauldia sp.]